MYMENQSEQFIRLLAEALEVDRSIRKSRTAARFKANAERFKQLFLSEQEDAADQPGSIHRSPDPRQTPNQDPLFH